MRASNANQALSTPPQFDARKYKYSGAYQVEKFQSQYAAEFKDLPKYNSGSMPELLLVLRRLGEDRRITDIRYTAYILATLFVESSHTVRITRETKDKKGKIRVHRLKVWRNFSAVDETGKGKGEKYALPAKVARLPTGDARVTEYDGQQWTISVSSGRSRSLTKGIIELGVPGTPAAHPTYEADEGSPQYYYGRGYVQLTWWANYAKAGTELGEGLKYLFEPSLVSSPDVAYELVVRGMVEGKVFAHGRKLSNYFDELHTDYVGARNMVNPNAKAANKVEVAHIAERFEKVLLASRCDGL